MTHGPDLPPTVAPRDRFANWEHADLVELFEMQAARIRELEAELADVKKWAAVLARMAETKQ